MSAPVLSIVIPTLDAAGDLGRCLGAVTSAAASEKGVELEVIVADGGSRDGTVDAGQALGAKVISSPLGRSVQLAAGARAASGNWLLFLHADTILDPDWMRAVADFMGATENACHGAYFRFALDDEGVAARRREKKLADAVSRLRAEP